MKRVLQRAAITALATILGISLLVESRTGPGTVGGRAALPTAGPAPTSPAPTPPASGPPATQPTVPSAPAEAATVPSTASTTRPPSTTATSRPPATAPPPPSTTATTARRVTTATVRPPTTVATARPTTTTTAAPETTTTTAAPTTSTTTAGAPGAQTVDGPVVDTRYGPVQVRLTLQGHQIVDVTNLALPNHAARSQQINNRAGPMLRQEVLNAQSAQIDTVSGATTTSAAYIKCVQAILDQAWQ